MGGDRRSGRQNSTVEELQVYGRVSGEELKRGDAFKGISKISVQTGTTHGGVPLADGTVAKVKIDFDVLELSDVARRQYGLAGAVQHGGLPQGVRPLSATGGGNPPGHGLPEYDLRQVFLPTFGRGSTII